MKKFVAWLPALAWMGVIFMMSAMPGDISGEQSGLVVEAVLFVISALFGPETAAAVSPDTISLLVRKGAHMTEYAVLFLLYRHALSASGAKKPSLFAFVLSVCYAATDEWHQAFVDSRGPALLDVGIDALGAGTSWIILSFIKRKKER